MKDKLSFIAPEIRNRHVLGFDVFAFLLIPAGALLLRVESLDVAGTYFDSLIFYTVCSLVWKLAIFFPFGMYNRYWRYASVDELNGVVMANLVSMVTGMVLFFAVLRQFGLVTPDFPRSIPIVDALLTTVLVGGSRFGLRVAQTMGRGEHSHSGKKKRVLIAGAGAAGVLILKELRTNPHLGIEPVGLLDDDERKHRMRLQGVAVLGKLAELPHYVKELSVDEVIIAMPTAPGKVVRTVVQMCVKAGVSSKTVPGIFEILGGKASVAQIRDIAIEDLLRRGVVQTDKRNVELMLRGRRVMVTGAGGSIGSELCRQICACKPSELVLVGHGENSIFTIASELHKQELEITTHSVIADVRDVDRMKNVFAKHRPEIIFHAAAHKHVGLMEGNLPDAITNNVLGTKVLVDLAEKFDVHRFVMISSDKAVNPTCAMGVTKRVAELVVHEVAERTKRPYVSVRFGNVLGSRGSVVPIFKEQIVAGGPVTVTHPKATRYFMTIPEAVQLVLQAGALGECGEVFVLDMGEPIKIADLARDLIRLSGFEEGKDIDIVYTGLKKGEKLTEELFHAEEHVRSSAHEKILLSRNGFRENPLLQQDVGRLINAAHTLPEKALHQLLFQIVPEYHVHSQPVSGELQLVFPPAEKRSVETGALKGIAAA
jgi:FlaA1/EpsC-like NDP-sugar epimerase